jgi:hypothetical protein
VHRRQPLCGFFANTSTGSTGSLTAGSVHCLAVKDTFETASFVLREYIFDLKLFFLLAPQKKPNLYIVNLQMQTLFEKSVLLIFDYPVFHLPISNIKQF